MAADEQQWVVAPDEARIEIAVGPEAKLSPELREALDNLARTLEKEQEVQGYLLGHCDEVSITQDCRYYMSCKGVTG
jgi:hypothetical protein